MGGRGPGQWGTNHCSGLFPQALTCMSSKCLPRLLLASTVTKEATISLEEWVIGSKEITVS